METVMDLIFREVRELGIGIIYVDQHPSLISYPALGNTSTHIYMNLGLDTKSSSDILDAAHMLGLRNTEEVDYLRRLPTGQAFILARKLAFPNPFLIQFPLVKVNKGKITDDDIKKIMSQKVVEDYRKKKSKQTKDTKKDILSSKEELEKIMKKLNSTDWRIIEVLGQGKAAFTSEIYSLLGMSGRTFKKKAENLINIGLIQRQKTKVYKQNSYYYFLTDNGEFAFKMKFGEFIEKDNVNIEGMKKVVLESYASEGFNVVRQEDDRMILEKDGKRIVINLVTESSITDFNDGMSFVCSSENVKNRVIQRSAKHAFENDLNLMIYVSTSDELMKNKNLNTLEFISESIITDK